MAAPDAPLRTMFAVERAGNNLLQPISCKEPAMTAYRNASLLAGFAFLAVLAGPARANEVSDWNVVAIAAAAAGGQNPVVLSRTLAMMHLAIHDALNAAERRYEPYLYQNRAAAGASPTAAVAAASRDVLVGVIATFGSPEQRAKALPLVESAYAAALAKIADGAAKSQGIAAGQAAADAMLAARKNDGVTTPVQYTPGTAPGKWRPHPNPVPPNPPVANPALAAGNQAAVLPQWGRVTPFVMATAAEFRLAGPPALASAAYARDYSEVKRLGAKLSTARTAQQEEIARYWYEPSPQGWNRVARAVAGERKLDLWANGRLLALVNAAMADGFVAGFETRYFYDFWRPVTAIRAGDTDGNDATVADPTWETFMNTPPLPEYPSTHSVLGGAAAAVLAGAFGTDRVAFKMTSGPPFPGITRSFASFSQASQENADARVYAGIHFRSACRDGIAQGEKIGRRAVAQYLLPLPK
jgi:hypothetical protein